MRHKMLTQHTLFVLQKRYAELAFRDACHTSSGAGGTTDMQTFGKELGEVPCKDGRKPS